MKVTAQNDVCICTWLLTVQLVRSKWGLWVGNEPRCHSSGAFIVILSADRSPSCTMQKVFCFVLFLARDWIKHQFWLETGHSSSVLLSGAGSDAMLTNFNILHSTHLLKVPKEHQFCAIWLTKRWISNWNARRHNSVSWIKKTKKIQWVFHCYSIQSSDSWTLHNAKLLWSLFL